MSRQGFTLVELLIAMVIALGVAGGALLLAGAARTAIVVEPASMDTVRRLREAAETIAAALSSAGGDRGIGSAYTTVMSALPALQLIADPGGGAFSGVAVTRVVNGGRGRVIADQGDPSGSLALSTDDGACPATPVVCGFRDGDVAAVFDDRGHFDIFIVGAVSESLWWVTPRAPLSHVYRAGAWVVEVRHERLLLVTQPDGSRTLTRITAAGAREPVVDGVTRLELEAWGRTAQPGLYASTAESRFAQYGLAPPAPLAVDPEGLFPAGSHCMASREDDVLGSTLSPLTDDGNGLSPLSPAEFDDGPWCPHEDAAGRFDADWFRVRRIDVRVRVEVLAAELRGLIAPWFSRGGTAAHDAPRWVRDREIAFSVAVGR